jgi:biopolymer transport protein TolR
MGMPTARRSFKEDEMELNLTPMMNLVALLIPVLLMSTAFVELATVNISMPSLGGSASDSPPPATDKPPLNLAILIAESAYSISATAPLGNGSLEMSIPIVQKTVDCGTFVGTVPVPRQRNKGEAPCKGTEPRLFWVYDRDALTKALIGIKAGYPDESRVILSAAEDTDYEALVEVMDSSRQYKDDAGEVHLLFDEVVLRPSP